MLLVTKSPEPWRNSVPLPVDDLRLFRTEHQHGFAKALRFCFGLLFMVLLSPLVVGQDSEPSTPEPLASGQTEEASLPGSDSPDIRQAFQLAGHSGPVYSTVFSPDSRQLVSAGGNFTEPGEFILWNTSDGVERLRFRGHQGPVYCVAFSPDGKSLASAGSDGFVRIWNQEDGTELQAYAGHTHEVYCVLYSRDGQQLISAGGTADQPGEIIVRDVRTGKEQIRLEGHSGAVLSLALSNDGRKLASAGLDRVIRIWDLSKNELLHSLTGHTSRINSIVFSKDGRKLFSSSGDRTIRQWNTADGSPGTVWTEAEPGQPSAETYQLDLDTSGDFVATAGADKVICVRDRKGNRKATLSGHSQAVKSIDFSADGRQLASAGSDGIVLLWSLPFTSSLPIFAGRTDPIGALLGESRSWIVSTAVSSDGRRIAIGDNANSVIIYDARTREVLHRLNGHTKWVTGVRFSGDGRWLASSSYDHSVIVWDTATGKEEFTWLTTGTVMCVAFSPDSRWIACNAGDEGSEIRVWEALTGEERYVLRKHGTTVMDLAFSPNGDKLASASNDGTAVLWDMKTGDQLQTYRGLKAGRSSNVWSVVFSPNGRTIATAGRDEQIHFWDTATGKESRTIDVSAGGIHDLVFSPDGKLLISASGVHRSIGEIRIWNAATGELIRNLGGHTDRVKAIAISPEGDWLVSASDDQTAKLWNLSSFYLAPVLPAEDGNNQDQP